MKKNSGISISVVVPVCGSGVVLKELHNRIQSEILKIGRPYEIVFVNDCCPGQSLQILRDIVEENTDVVVVELIQNVGQLRATVQGIAIASGEIIVTIDDDLQQWPEDIVLLLKELEENNFDLVVGRFSNRKHSVFRNIAGEVARRMAIRSLPVGKGTHFSSFRVMRREVFEKYFGDGSIRQPPPGWMYFSAQRHAEVEVRHSERVHGKSSYSIGSLLNSFWPLLDGLVGVGLQVAVLVSIAQIFVAVIGGVYVGIEFAKGNIDSPGYTSIVLLLLSILGIFGVGIALLAQYLRSIKKLIVDKPQSMIQRVIR